MAYNQKQGRNSFRKTGEGITSNLTGVDFDPTDPPKDVTTDEGVSARIRDIVKGVQTGKATIGRAESALYYLQGASTGNEADYNLYRKDSKNIATKSKNLIGNATYNYGNTVHGLSGKDAVKKLKKYNSQ